MAMELSERVAQIVYKAVEENNKKNAEVLSDPFATAPANADGTPNPNGAKNVAGVMQRISNNSLLLKIADTLSTRLHDNARDIMKS